MRTLNTSSRVSDATKSFLEKRILNYYPELTAKDYNKIMELEYHGRQHLQGVATALGFTFYNCPLVIVKEYYLEKYPDDIILAKYWTARIARTQSTAPEKQRSFQKTAGFATLYGGSSKISWIPNQP